MLSCQTCCNAYVSIVSMQIRHSKHFHSRRHPHCTMLSLLLKLSTLPGVNGQKRKNICPSGRHWMLRRQNLMNTIRSQPIRMHIFWRWASSFHGFDYQLSIQFIVLHPGKKMLHFKKYWSPELQAEVYNLLKIKVCCHHIV